MEGPKNKSRVEGAESLQEDSLARDKTDELLGVFVRNELCPSPFLRGRILAVVREHQAKRKQARLYWGIGLTVPIALMLAAILSPWTLRTSLDGVVEQRMALLIDPATGTPSQVSAVQVELPDGVEFYSERIPELRSRAVLTLPWKPSRADGAIPLVIRAHRAGTQWVTVRYLDSANRELKERKLRIRFRAAGPQETSL